MGGACCVSESDQIAPKNPQKQIRDGKFRPATKRENLGSALESISTDVNLDQALLLSPAREVKEVMKQQNLLTVAQRQEQAEHFLSFKSQRAFKRVKRFIDHYTLRRELGGGAFGSVKLGQHKKSQVPCAIKVIRKASLKEDKLFQQLNRNEFATLEETVHPHITRVFELMEDDRCYFIIMELVSGGNLFDMIKNKRKFSEADAANIIKQLLLALNYMHGLNIMHRDLKPENLLCETNDEGKIIIKITDFGFATKFNPNKPQTLSLGSPLYMAPELCDEKAYDCKVDVWAAGVLTFVLLTGKMPFQGQRKEDIFYQICYKQPDWKLLNLASSQAVDFVKACLQKVPEERQTVQELLEYDWFKTHQRQHTISEDQQLNIGTNLAQFSQTTAFQSGVCSIIANLQTKTEELGDLREMFLKLDTNSDGFLTFDELEAGMQDIASVFQQEEPDVRAMLNAADTNGDGQIDYTEFLAAAFQKDILLSSQNLRAAFSIFDKDGDGSINKEDLKQVFGDRRALTRGESVWDEIMAEVDKNQDGKIQFEEFEEAMRNVIQQHAASTLTTTTTTV